MVIVCHSRENGNPKQFLKNGFLPSCELSQWDTFNSCDSLCNINKEITSLLYRQF